MSRWLGIIYFMGLLLALCGCVATIQPDGYYYDRGYYYEYPRYRYYYYDYGYPYGHGYYYRFRRH